MRPVGAARYEVAFVVPIFSCDVPNPPGGYMIAPPPTPRNKRNIRAGAPLGRAPTR
jgi:hypothetical protein